MVPHDAYEARMGWNAYQPAGMVRKYNLQTAQIQLGVWQRVLWHAYQINQDDMVGEFGFWHDRPTDLPEPPEEEARPTQAAGSAQPPKANEPTAWPR